MRLKPEYAIRIHYKEFFSSTAKINRLPNFEYGIIWEDKVNGHRIGCLDASKKEDVEKLMKREKAVLAVQDPPYNVAINDEFGNLPLDQYMNWSEKWVDNTLDILHNNSSFYVWLGADVRGGLQPLPDFILMMRNKPVKIRSFITMRNQRGYGTQKNWMAIRQELLYYIKGEPVFDVQAEYTDIPKKTKGYYKKVNGKMTGNFERSKSLTIRAGNVWHDIQQVFYLMHENVEGCFAQKPLKSAKRIIEASSKTGDHYRFFWSFRFNFITGGIEQKKMLYDGYKPELLQNYGRSFASLQTHGRNRMGAAKSFERRTNFSKR